jgi:alpha-L-rhamnosidase
MDVRHPRLGWTLAAEERGQRQTAYQVLVASSVDLLDPGRVDLWNSGKVASDESVQVVYGGKALASRMQCHWTVRVWDAHDQVSAWSPTAAWTMGLLDAADWHAHWIADAGTNAIVQVARPANGYHSQIAGSAATEKWALVDLGAPRLIDGIRLFPARPFDWLPDTPGFLFPLRFRVELAEQPDFADGRTVIDQSSADVPNPGTNAPSYQFTPTRAQFIRLRVTQLPRRDGTNFAFALAELQVLAAGQPVSPGAKAMGLDSIESGGWSLTHLTDGVLTTVNPPPGEGALPATLLRRTFEVTTPIRRATVYATALGLYELRVNGRRVGDQLLAPEWTNYRKRVQVQTHDVTGLLRDGENTLAAMVGEGWYAGRLMLVGRGAYGPQPAFLLQLEIEQADGSRRTIVTDESWESTTDGPIRSSGIYDGEVYDARKERPGWDVGGDPSNDWRPVRDFGLAAARPSKSAPLEGELELSPKLVWQPNEPIRVVRELTPRSVTEPKPGVYVFDLGQNMVGWCRVSGEGLADVPVTIRHAEMLEEDGMLYTANLRAAPQVNRYIPRQDGPFRFEPHFTYQGFRYVEVSGLAAAPTADAVLGRVFHSSAPDAGTFECSEALLNQLMRNIVWTQRGNLMSSPNDCPQRDERFGWMGDIQVFGQTAMFNLNLGAFFTKWLRDVRDDQADDGRFPDFAPHPGNPNLMFSGAPAWADAGVIVPWHAYVNYGDVRLIEEQFEAARRWVDYVQGQNPDLLWRKSRHNDYNDWLNGDWIKQADWPAQGASVTNEVLATAFFAHSTELVSRMARVLGRDAEAATYTQRAQEIRGAFNRAFVDRDGRMVGDTQAGYALALNFNLLPEEQRPRAVQHLVAGIRRYQGHLSTGIQSTHRLMLELTRAGQHALAWQLVTNRTFPSWGYMIENGATTIWERWDGYVRGRGFQDAGMNSFNHWALGAVGEWVWRHVAGIQPDETQPGYRRVVIAPHPGGGVTWARAEHRSIRGPISTYWKLAGDQFVLEVRLPPNVTATVRVPTSAADQVRESGRLAAESGGVHRLRTEPDAVWFEVGSGHYVFEAAR